MENPQTKSQERENPFLQTSPNTSSNSSSSTNGVPPTTPSPPPPPPPPKPISRSEPNNNAYPTTFIQADTSSFKRVVQMLTGSSETAKNASKAPDPSAKPSPPPAAAKTGPKKPAFKLYERRSSLKNLKISPLMPGFHTNYTASFSPRNKPEILSPSLLDFPSLVLSPVTPLIPDPFNRPTTPGGAWGSSIVSAEERAMAEKGFYLHPPPVSTPRDSEPRLLPLFPVTSPRLSGSS